MTPHSTDPNKKSENDEKNVELLFAIKTILKFPAISLKLGTYWQDYNKINRERGPG